MKRGIAWMVLQARARTFNRAGLLLVTLAFLAASLAPLPKAAAQFAFDIPAEAAILVEAESGRVLWEKDADKLMPPASIVKIMTLLLIFEAVEKGIARWDDRVTTSRTATEVIGSKVWLSVGETRTLEDMTKAIAIASGNDASVAVAEFLAGTEQAFVEAMNRRARELGMVQTHFANTHGLPTAEGVRDNISTAREITVMARALLRFPKALEMTSTWREPFRRADGFVLENTNKLMLRYEGADGLKTGHTREAGWALVGTARRDDLRLISVVLRTESDEQRLSQTMRMLDFGFRNFRRTVAAARGETVGSVRIWDGVPEQVPVRAQEALRVVTRVGEERELRRRLVPAADVRAPVRAGQVVGELEALVGDTVLGRVPLEAARDVERAGIFARIWRWAKDFFVNLFASNKR